MLVRTLKLAVPFLLAAIGAFAIACNGDGEPADQATPTGPVASPLATMEEATATPPATSATATPAPDIRQEDLTQQPALRDSLAMIGGEVDAGSIIYVDLTEDGVEDAIVPVSSGGTMGDIAVFVFGYGSDGLGLLLEALPQQSSSIHAELDGQGRLVTEEGIFGPNDPLCCPSEVLRRYYRWDGTALVVDREEQVPAQ